MTQHKIKHHPEMWQDPRSRDRGKRKRNDSKEQQAQQLISNFLNISQCTRNGETNPDSWSKATP